MIGVEVCSDLPQFATEVADKKENMQYWKTCISDLSQFGTLGGGICVNLRSWRGRNLMHQICSAIASEIVEWKGISNSNIFQTELEKHFK